MTLPIRQIDGTERGHDVKLICLSYTLGLIANVQVDGLATMSSSIIELRSGSAISCLNVPLLTEIKTDMSLGFFNQKIRLF